MASEFQWRRRVEFSDTDMAGIMHFANFFRFMESAEHAFFRSLGFTIHSRERTPESIGWPRVQAQCDYKAPLYFEDEVEIQLVVRERTGKSLSYDFYFRQAGDAQRTLRARGSLTAVCVRWDATAQRMRATAIPAAIAAAIEPATAERLAALSST